MIILSCPDYVFRGEFLWFGMVIHLEIIGPYTKHVKIRLVDDFRLIARSIHQPVYAFQTKTHDPLKEKFIMSVGFAFHHYRTTSEGEWAKMFILNPLEVKALAS